MKKKRDIAGAEDMYRLAMGADPKCGGAVLGLAHIQYHVRKNVEAAEKLYIAGTKLVDDAEGLFSYGMLLRRERGDADSAMVMLERCLRINANHVPALREMSSLLLDNGVLACVKGIIW